MSYHIVVVAAVLLHTCEPPPDYPYTGPYLRVSLLETLDGRMVLPGGKLELGNSAPGFNGETPDEAIRRELREEVGFSPAVMQLSFDRTTHSPHDAVMLYYSGTLSTKDVARLRNAEPHKHVQLVSVGVNKLPIDKMWAHDVQAISRAVTRTLSGSHLFDDALRGAIARMSA